MHAVHKHAGRKEMHWGKRVPAPKCGTPARGPLPCIVVTRWKDVTCQKCLLAWKDEKRRASTFIRSRNRERR